MLSLQARKNPPFSFSSNPRELKFHLGQAQVCTSLNDCQNNHLNLGRF